MVRKALTLLGCATLCWSCTEHVRIDDPRLLASGEVVPGSSSSSGSSSTGSSSTGSSSTGFHAIALRGGDPLLGTIYADSGFGETIQSSLTSGSFSDPNFLVLIVGNLELACASPLITSTCDFGTTWHEAWAIPLDLVRVGAIDLTSPRVGFLFDEAIPPAIDGRCSGGYGLGLGNGGTLEIVSNDDDGLSLKLSGASANVPIDGDYRAPRCGPKPDEIGPKPALAVRGAVVPPDVVPGVDPAAWSIFLTSAAQSCSDPWTALDCEQRSWITFQLPEELRKPGTIAMNDPRISAQIAALGCKGGLEPFTAGSIEITAADPTAIELHVLGTHTFTDYEAVDVDGLYRASACP